LTDSRITPRPREKTCPSCGLPMNGKTTCPDCGPTITSSVRGRGRLAVLGLWTAIIGGPINFVAAPYLMGMTENMDTSAIVLMVSVLVAISLSGLSFLMGLLTLFHAPRRASYYALVTLLIAAITMAIYGYAGFCIWGNGGIGGVAGG